jgi:NifU-like protein involved in Fe-S cluster formation/bacterioferritin-associated ferredoxin
MAKAAAKTRKAKIDVVNRFAGGSWAYTDAVKDHFFRPRNLLLENPDTAVYDAEGMVGSPACGDVMRVWLKIDRKADRIKGFKWRTFGCASAIAATSMLSVMATENGGMKIDKVLKIKPQDIMKRLGGLPDRKIHCSVLGDKALRAAINDWFKKTNQLPRIVVEGARLVDPDTKVTEADIEEAVIDGATTLEAVQQRTKVGIGNPQCIPEAEELIRFYREKYFGPDAK